MTIKKTLNNLKEMEEFANLVVSKILSSSATKEAIVLGLYGDLGSGKTTFTQFFVKAFGIKQTVTSPTFVIEKIYKLPKNKKFKHIIHIDAYRLNSGEEMKDLGWDQIVSDPQNIILIEWPERIEEILPKNVIRIDFKFIDENQREIFVENSLLK